MHANPKSAPSGKRTLRLLAQQLTKSDIARLTTFLRIRSDRLTCEWQLVTEGEANLLLMGNEDPLTVPGLLDDPMSVMQVVDPDARRPDLARTLVRPLQYDAVVDALLAVELKALGKQRAPAAAATVSQTSSRTAPSSSSPAPASSTPQAPQSAARTLAGAFTLSPGARFRLRRWPPAQLLQGHRYHVRLASCLSARHVGLDELARLSNVDKPACEAFVAQLMKANVLDVKLATAAKPPASRTDTAPDSTLSTITSPYTRSGHSTLGGDSLPRVMKMRAPSVSASLLSRVRRTLGIAR